MPVHEPSLLKVCRQIFLVLSILGLWTLTAFAASVFIAAPNRADMVHDPVRNILYITSGGDVLRYSLATRQFLSPFQLAGDLRGIDLSPDANTLAVADNFFTGIHLIDLLSETRQKVILTKSFWEGEGGGFSVAFGNDGNLLVSTSFNGSGWVPLRKYNISTGETTTLLTTISQDSMLSSSADGSVIGFAEGNNSSGPWGRYRVSDDDIVHRTGYDNGTFWFNYEIGTNRNGTQFAIPTYGGTFIYNSDFLRIATLGQYAGQQPIGVVYHPTEDIVYFAWVGTTEVHAFETVNFQQVATYDFEKVFSQAYNWAYQEGRLKISRDGVLLFATVEGGIRYANVFAKGDVNGTGAVDLADAVLALQVSAGIKTTQKIYKQADVDGDRRIGLGEAIYDLQDLAHLRNNHAPVLNSIGNKTIDEGVELSFTINAADKDNDTLSFSATPLPEGASFNAAAKAFSWSPTYAQSGQYQVTFLVRDDFGGQASETITITVNDRPPIYTAAEYYPLNVGDWRDYYLSSTASTKRYTVSGTKLIGTVLTMVENSPSGVKDYMTSDQNGYNVYGQYDPDYNMEIIFERPLLLLPNTLQVGTSHASAAQYTVFYSGSLYHVNINLTVNIIGVEDVQTGNTVLHDCLKISARTDQYIVENGSSLPGDTLYLWLYKGVGEVKVVEGNDTYIITGSSVNGIQKSY